MALSLKIDRDTYDMLDDEERTLYLEGEDENTYLLDIEIEPSPLKRALDRTRQERDGYLARLATAKEIDPDVTTAVQKYRDTLARAATDFKGISNDEELAAVLAKDKAATDAEIARLTSEHEETIAPINAKLLALRTERTLTEAMADAGVVAPALLLPHLHERVRVELDGRGVRVTVVDADGLARIREDGQALSVGELLREWQTLDPTLSRWFAEPIAMRTAMMASQHGKNGKAH